MKSVLPLDWEVPALFRKRLGESAGRQRAMVKDGHLLLVLHQPPLPGVPERQGRLFWREPGGEWRSNSLGSGVQSLRRHLAELSERVDQLEAQWENSQTARDYYALLRAVAPLHRTARNLHATLQHARELVPEDPDLINLRDQAGDLERATELLHHDAKTGLDFTVAFQSEQQTEQAHAMAVAAHRLNLLVATFFPVATLSAVFGMNLHLGIEPEHHPTLFAALLVAGLVSGLLLALVIVKKPSRPSAPAKKYVKKPK